ncbi:MAG: xylulokinase [Gammaproteobacteria bacterium]|nr:MAG: xylulokinase [Gammaproteobacteria bacterium]
MEKSVIGVDLGTQGLKLIAYDPDNKQVIDCVSAPLEMISHSDGSREQLAQWWVEAFQQCIHAIPASIRKTVVAIGVSGQQHGFVPVDSKGNVLAPVKLWCDTSTKQECAAIIHDIGGNAANMALTGVPLKVGYTASKIRWFRDHHPELYQRMSRILLPHDYLNFFLTGNSCMEYGDASGTGLLDVRHRCWSKPLIEALDPNRDLTPCLPPLVDSHQKAGTLRPGLAAALGLPNHVMVSAGGGDNMMAAIGTGNIVPGKLTASLGTSGTLFAFADRPLIDPQGELAAFCSSSGGWLPLLCTMNCTIAIEQIRNLLHLQDMDLEALAGSIGIGADGVLTLPFYNGERTPDLPNGKAVIFGLDNTNTTSAHLLRSAMESAIFGMKNGLSAFSRCGLQFSEVTLTGGGSNSALWRQICCDILDLPVNVLQQNENAAFGACLQALWCHSHEHGNGTPLQDIVHEHLAYDKQKACMPNKKSVNAYKEIYQRYLALIEAVTPLY